MSFEIDICNRHGNFVIDERSLESAIRMALKIEGVASAVLSVSLVDDNEIHSINREHLQHDYPTDVISFQLDFSTASGWMDHSDSDDSEESEDFGLDDYEAADAFTDDESVDEELGDDAHGHDACEPQSGLNTDVLDEQRSAQTQARAAEPGLRAVGAAIEGEIIASVDTASRMAGRAGWSVQDELTLYVVHGLLHICGYDDLTADERSVMRSREQAIMTALGKTMTVISQSDDE